MYACESVRERERDKEREAFVRGKKKQEKHQSVRSRLLKFEGPRNSSCEETNHKSSNQIWSVSEKDGVKVLMKKKDCYAKFFGVKSDPSLLNNFVEN